MRKLKESEAIFLAALAAVRSDQLSLEAVEVEEEKRKAAEKKREEEKEKGPRIRPLSETKAIDAGANFISETFLFAIAAGLILFETFRSRRKEAKRKDVVQERLDLLEERNRQDEMRLEELERRDRSQEQVILKLMDEVWQLSGGKGEKPSQKKEWEFTEWEKKPLYVKQVKGTPSIWKRTKKFITGGSSEAEEEDTEVAAVGPATSDVAVAKN